MTVKLNSKKTNGSKILRFNFLSSILDTEGNSDFLDFWSNHSWSDYETIIVGISVPGFSQTDCSVDSHGVYNLATVASTKLAKQLVHIRKQLEEQMQAKKRIIIVLDDLKEYKLSGTEHKKYIDSPYSIVEVTNYWVLYDLIGPSSKHIGNKVFNYKSADEITKRFIEDSGIKLSYAIKLRSGMNNFTPLFKDNNGNILGGVARTDFTLPVLLVPKVLTEKVENISGFVARNVEALIGLYKSLCTKNEKETRPNWVHDVDYIGVGETEINSEIKKLEDKKSQLEQEIIEQNDRLSEYDNLKPLLYGGGKELEDAVIYALSILGISATNFKDEYREFDVCFEYDGKRYLGEVEGKDNKQIKNDKINQLISNLNSDFARDDVTEKAKGLLFGNAFRTMNPLERKECFTDKCVLLAKENNITLIKTSDLYTPCVHALYSGDEDYIKKCVIALGAGGGKVAIFPEPNNL